MGKARRLSEKVKTLKRAIKDLKRMVEESDKVVVFLAGKCSHFDRLAESRLDIIESLEESMSIAKSRLDEEKEMGDNLEDGTST